MRAADLAPLIAVGVYVVVSFILNLKPRVAAAMALGLLLASAIALTMGKKDIAAALATYFYYLLVATLLLTLISRLWKHENREPGNGETDT
jgi:peptidoglycan/LPS O-acetylase OafA/YrhL